MLVLVAEWRQKRILFLIPPLFLNSSGGYNFKCRPVEILSIQWLEDVPSLLAQPGGLLLAHGSSGTWVRSGLGSRGLQATRDGLQGQRLQEQLQLGVRVAVAEVVRVVPARRLARILHQRLGEGEGLGQGRAALRGVLAGGGLRGGPGLGGGPTLGEGADLGGGAGQGAGGARGGALCPRPLARRQAARGGGRVELLTPARLRGGPVLRVWGVAR